MEAESSHLLIIEAGLMSASASHLGPKTMRGKPLKSEGNARTGLQRSREEEYGLGNGLKMTFKMTVNY